MKLPLPAFHITNSATLPGQRERVDKVREIFHGKRKQFEGKCKPLTGEISTFFVPWRFNAEGRWRHGSHAVTCGRGGCHKQAWKNTGGGEHALGAFGFLRHAYGTPQAAPQHPPQHGARIRRKISRSLHLTHEFDRGILHQNTARTMQYEAGRRVQNTPCSHMFSRRPHAKKKNHGSGSLRIDSGAAGRQKSHVAQHANIQPARPACAFLFCTASI